MLAIIIIRGHQLIGGRVRTRSQVYQLWGQTASQPYHVIPKVEMTSVFGEGDVGKIKDDQVTRTTTFLDNKRLLLTS